MIWLLWMACSSHDPEVQRAFDIDKAKALAKPAKVPAKWTPDLSVHLQPTLLGDLVALGLEENGRLKHTIKVTGATIDTDLSVKKLSLRAGKKTCDTCLLVDATLKGRSDYEAALIGSGHIPTTIQATLEVSTVVEKVGKEWVVRLIPKKVKKLDVQLRGVNRTLEKLAQKPLQDWTTNELKSIKPIQIARYGGEELPIAALKVVMQGKVARLDALLQVPKRGAVSSEPVVRDAGFVTQISSQSLLSVARKAAYEHGEVTDGITAVPTSLRFNGEQLVFGLRLYKLSGNNWWRDYEIKANIEVTGRGVKVSPKQVKQVKASDGAVMADPLVFLAEGIIIKTIEESLMQSLPSKHSMKLPNNKTAKVVVSGFEKRGDDLLLLGELSIAK